MATVGVKGLRTRSSRRVGMFDGNVLS